MTRELDKISYMTAVILRNEKVHGNAYKAITKVLKILEKLYKDGYAKQAYHGFDQLQFFADLRAAIGFKLCELGAKHWIKSGFSPEFEEFPLNVVVGTQVTLYFEGDVKADIYIGNPTWVESKQP